MKSLLNKLSVSIYVHMYCAYFCRETWLKYCLYCVLQNKKPSIKILGKLITIKKIIKSL